jgi:diaminopimelate epimerase
VINLFFLIPSTICFDISIIGNVIDSVSITVTLPKEKVDRIKDECLRLQKKNKTSIREVSRIIGILISSFSAVDYGNLHYMIFLSKVSTAHQPSREASVVIELSAFPRSITLF